MINNIKKRILIFSGIILLIIGGWHIFYEYFVLPPKNIGNQPVQNTTKIKVSCYDSTDFKNTITDKKIISTIISDLEFKRIGDIFTSASTPGCAITFYLEDAKNSVIMFTYASGRDQGEIGYEELDSPFANLTYGSTYQTSLNPETQKLLFKE